MLGMLIFGPALLELLGGRGNVLAQAVAYTQIFFGGAVVPWLMNTMAGHPARHRQHEAAVADDALLRRLPDRSRRHARARPRPDPAIRHARRRRRLADRLSDQHLRDGAGICSPAGRASFRSSGGFAFEWAMFFDILKVGAIACFSPLQSVLTISIFTHMLASFGTEILAGYGIGARLEFMLTSIAFAVGIASVPMVGMAIGARARRARAADLPGSRGSSRSSRSARSPASSRSSPTSGSTSSPTTPSVRAASRQYLSTAAPMYAFIGLVDVDVFLLARRGQGAGPGAGANRAAVVHRRRRLVAVDARRDRRRISSCWRPPRWCCSACCPASA